MASLRYTENTDALETIDPDETREEIDALRTMGFDPIEVLILPRMLALVIAIIRTRQTPEVDEYADLKE